METASEIKYSEHSETKDRKRRHHEQQRAVATRPVPEHLAQRTIPVSIYLVNGIKLQGQIESFDQYVVLLKNTVTQMVYKHAISTVVPARPVNLSLDHSSDS